MIQHSDESIKAIVETPEFKKDYGTYRSQNTETKEFRKFIDSIEINKKYFRLAMNKQGYRRKHQRGNVGEDTLAIKEITSYLNKVTEQTIDRITGEIQKRLVDKDYLMPLIVDSVIEKSLLYTQYIPMYLGLVKDLYRTVPDIKETFMGRIDVIHKGIVEAEVNTEESDYLQFCAKNKRLDKLIGHSMLITECEKQGFVEGRIHPTLDSFLTLLAEEDDPSETYKCVQCLYNIMKSLYGRSRLPQGYITRIQGLIDTEKSAKIKYKMMDILERR